MDFARTARQIPVERPDLAERDVDPPIVRQPLLFVGQYVGRGKHRSFMISALVHNESPAVTFTVTVKPVRSPFVLHIDAAAPMPRCHRPK
nr:hypothetical protein [Burkholderia anthina]